MFHPRVHRALVVLAFALSFPAARAGTITVTRIDGNRGLGTGTGEHLYINENGAISDVYFAGVLLIRVSDGLASFNRDALCVDLFTDIQIGRTFQTTLLRPDQVPGKHLDRVSWLVDNVLAPDDGTTFYSTLSSDNWVTTPAQGAGVQLAIWDIVHDGGDGFYAGSVQASTALGRTTDAEVLGWAMKYEMLSQGMSSDFAFVYDNVDVNGKEVQMLIGPRFTDGPQPPVPEPSTFALALLPLLGLLVCRRMRPRRAASGGC